MASDLEKGFAAGVGVLIGELVLFAGLQVVNAMSDAAQQLSPSLMISVVDSSLSILSIANLVQCIIIGYAGTEGFIGGFIFGDFVVLIGAGALSTIIPSAVIGMVTAVVGVVIGLALRSGKRQEYRGWY